MTYKPKVYYKEDRKRCCCNCGRNKRVEEKGHTNCYCELDNHYIGYVEAFTGLCNRWKNERKWDD